METSAKIENREVIIYNTTGKGYQNIMTAALSWKELKKSLDEARITYANMKAVIGETQLTVESDDAQLPAEAFTLFLMPVKVKSGSGLDRKTLFTNIKELIASNPGMKEKFIVDGKNMTQLSTDKLNELWNKYGKSGATTQAPAPTPAVGAVVESVRKSKEPKATEKPSEQENLLKELDLFLAENVNDDDADTIKDMVGRIIKASSTPGFVPSFDVEETDADVQRRIEKDKEAHIAKMAEKLRGKFPDVK